MNAYGIAAYDVYLPRYRISRRAITEATEWATPRSAADAVGERTMCDWDEDSITMGVEAARGALHHRDPAAIDSLFFATTTAPFADRQNAAVIADAIRLRESTFALDIGSSLRAGVSALALALRNQASGDVLLIAADKRRTKSGSAQELQYGDGAAAFVLSRQNVIAQVLDTRSVTCDFVDHFRSAHASADYHWEERWVRDEGYLRIIVDAVEPLLARAGVATRDINHFIVPTTIKRVPEMLADRLGIDPESIAKSFGDSCGNTGIAHPLLMLCEVLAVASPGDKILMTGFGQGCDAILLEATAEISRYRPAHGCAARLAERIVETHYHKFLAFSGSVDVDWGMRAEIDAKTSLSSHYRNRRMLQSFIGGRCRACGTAQFPKAHACVNPACRSTEGMDDEPMSDIPGTIASFTTDWLGYTPHPPLHFGMVQFANGAKVLMDFTSSVGDKLQVGTAVNAVFRVKAIDAQRGFRRYFWKMECRA